MHSKRIAALLAALLSSPCTADKLSTAEDTLVIILSASRYWFNYRHASGALTAYDLVRRLGVPDDRVLLFLAEDPAWDGRNPFPGAIFNADLERNRSVYPLDVEVDFSGSSVTVSAFLGALAGRAGDGVPGRRALPALPTRSANLLVYMTGHGGDGFLKFADKEEMTYADAGHALHEGWLRGRFGRALVLADTCQAGSLGEWLHTPGVTLIASSVTGQNSYAAGRDDSSGLALSDGFSRAIAELVGAQLLGEADGGGRVPKVRARGTWVREAAAAAGAGAGAGGGDGYGVDGDGWRSVGFLPTACSAGGEQSSRMKDACAYLAGARRAPEAMYAAPASASWAQAGGGGEPDGALSLSLFSLLLPEWRVSSTVNARAEWAWGGGLEGEPLLRFLGRAGR